LQLLHEKSFLLFSELPLSTCFHYVALVSIESGLKALIEVRCAVFSAEEACDNPVYLIIGDGDNSRRALIKR